MNLFSKIFGVGCIGILLASITCGISLYTNNVIREKIASEENYRSFRTEIVDAQRAHLAWLRTIQNAISDNAQEIKIVTDGKVCAFGKWYYGEGDRRTEKMIPELHEKFNAIAPGHLDVHTMGAKLISLWDPKNPQAAIDYFHDEINPTADKLLADLNELNTLSLEQANKIQKESQWLLDNAALPVWIALGICAAATLACSYLVANGIVSDLKSGTRILQRLVDVGDLHMDIPVKIQTRKDEIGEVGRSLEKVLNEYRQVSNLAEHLANGNWNVDVNVKSTEDIMNQSLSTMITGINATLANVKNTVNVVETSSRQIASAAEQVSNSTAQSASSVEQISAVMVGLNENMQNNVDTANRTKQAVSGANEVAADGQSLMKELLGSMTEITKTSATVKQVIKMIDDIAFQTNLLALNAAVEAARAGQHGKGFAVVAEEVRNLAARSAKAAKETADLIDQSNRQIGSGATLAEKTGVVLDKIVESQKEVSQLIENIAQSSREQAEGVSQVVVGVRQIEEVTQKNASGAEETSSESKNLSAQAHNLNTMVSQFVLRNNH
ncbi:MAG: methyl-accepting chemotaxis protein [Thermoguttaceae bacterium]